ncbi:MAG: sigma-70 family RNA polymerase sigma factor [Vampirovibrionales bacterium]|nr:sigma-70 family RNA polymerase sigma factor [Vampirovibrionales bacterium]
MPRKSLSDKVFTPELNEMLLRYSRLQEASPVKTRLRNEIVSRVMPYVTKIARGLARRNTDPVDDIIQTGSIGLLKAIDKYNPASGASFKTYATYLITGEIRHYLRDKTGMIKAPRQIYELYYRVNQIVHRLSEDLGRMPTDVEIAEFLECPLSKVTQAQEADRRRAPISLDQFVTSGGGETVYLETLVDDKYFEVLSHSENKITLENELVRLSDELRAVVQMTYYDDLSQNEIAQRLGISQMQVSRRLRKALDLLSRRLSQPAKT